MTIVCGTDLSSAAGEAADVAALLAARSGTPLVLVHATVQSAAGARTRLDEEADRLRALGAGVETVTTAGDAARSIVEAAAERGADLIVIAPVGEHGYGRLLGTTAARVIGRAEVPVLAVRSAEPFRAWLSGRRALRATVGVDDSKGAAAALRWIERLRAVAPCDVTAVHVASPLEEQRRLGLPGPVDLEHLSAAAQQVLRRELAERVGALAGAGGLELVVRHGLGRVDADLADAAERAQADLVVVGSHQWSGLERVVRGSVSRAVLHSAAMSVACVPAGADGQRRVAPVDTVLVATDLSPLAAAAVPHAYALLRDGGTVHLLTVEENGRADLPEERLRALVPPDADARGIRTELHVVRGRDAAAAICAAAERLGVDVVCVGTHGRSGLTEAVMGSVAGAVLRCTRRPVLMVRA